MAGNVRKRATGQWLVTYYVDGKRRYKTYSRKLDADNFLTTTQADQVRGDWVDPRDGKVTVREYGEQWLKHRHIRPTTREGYEYDLRYVNLLGDVPMSSLTPSMLEAWQAQLLDHLAPSTTAVIRGVFAAMLNTAVRDRVIPRSPIEGVKAPKPLRKLVRPMPVETVHAIRDSMAPRYRAAIDVGAGCGLRRGECFALTVDRVNFLGRMLTVDRGLVKTKGGPTHFGPPKTDASVRDVPMPQFVVDALAAHIAKYPPGPDGLIFTTMRNTPVSKTTFRQAWHDAQVRMWARTTGQPLRGDSIPIATREAFKAAHPAGYGTRYHDLRHFYVSMLIKSGASIKVVQARVGHATAAETLDTYAHLWPSDDDLLRKALDDAFNAANAASENSERASLT